MNLRLWAALVDEETKKKGSFIYGKQTKIPSSAAFTRLLRNGRLRALQRVCCPSNEIGSAKNKTTNDALPSRQADRSMLTMTAENDYLYYCASSFDGWICLLL